MLIVTNRRVTEGRSDPHALGDRPSDLGPNELRFFTADPTPAGTPDPAGNTFRLKPIPDTLPADRIDQLALTPADRAALDADQPLHGSRWAADRLVRDGRHAVFFVHGYNTTVADALARAAQIERDFGVQVVVFSWPANGGGIRGTASYLADKADARASAPALLRALHLLGQHLLGLRAPAARDVAARLRNTSPDGPRLDRLAATAAASLCPIALTLLGHSMGNYLLKQVFMSALATAIPLLFDNVVLSAADTNHRDHPRWVDRIDCRNRLYVCINEDDAALGVSRMKAGDLQRARLGHTARQLDAARATYVDFTDAPHIGRAHTYFGGDPLSNNHVRAFFQQAFTGQRAERPLPYNPARNLHRLADVG
ncbi:MAG: alpha/beta hydrolase [Planctomycetota bacterium]